MHKNHHLAGKRQLQAHGFMVGDGGCAGGGGGSSASGGGGEALAAFLMNAESESRSSRRKVRQSEKSHEVAKLARAQLDEIGAEWVRSRFRLLLINTEGILKKPANLSMPQTTPKSGHDSFLSDMLPFLRALLIGGGDGVGEGGGGGSSEDVDMSAGKRLRDDAPRLALLSDLGHQCTARENGALLEEEKVRTVLSNLVRRVCHELGLSEADATTLQATTGVYHSFTPLSHDEPNDTAKFHSPSKKGPEWSHDWCRPKPGALHRALVDTDVRPHEALFVRVNENDQLAAEAADIPSIRLPSLLSGEPASHVCMPGKDGGGSGRGKGKAPVAFDSSTMMQGAGRRGHDDGHVRG